MLFFWLSSILLIKNDINFNENHPILYSQEQNPTINCQKFLNYTLFEDGLNFSCTNYGYNNINNYYKYDEFVKYQINTKNVININFNLTEVSDDLPEENLIKIISLINLTETYEELFHIAFYGSLNVTKIEKYFKLFPTNFTYDFRVVFYTNGCYWEKKNLPPINFIKYEEIKDHWTNVCISSIDKTTYSMFHYSDDNETVEIKIIGPKEILIIALVIVFFFLFILLTSFSIVICRCIKANKNSKQE